MCVCLQVSTVNGDYSDDSGDYHDDHDDADNDEIFAKTIVCNSIPQSHI